MYFPGYVQVIRNKIPGPFGFESHGCVDNVEMTKIKIKTFCK